MGIISSKEQSADKKAIHYQVAKSQNLLLIFTRNPVLGKCKTRLAETVGNKTALDIYTFLLNHTANITKAIDGHKRVYYSEEIWENDIWDKQFFDKRLQQGKDLGERMAQAFLEGFEDGFKNIIIIGSDMYDLTPSELEAAFDALKKNDFVLGPAEDGGYYLLGMRHFKKNLFCKKDWGKNNVLQDTLNDLANEKTQLLAIKNDVDVYADIEHIEAFRPFLKNI